MGEHYTDVDAEELPEVDAVAVGVDVGMSEVSVTVQVADMRDVSLGETAEVMVVVVLSAQAVAEAEDDDD